LSEYGYGVAILSESKYGFATRGNVMSISLLRAATAPDAEQDQGERVLSADPVSSLIYFAHAKGNMTSLGRYSRMWGTSSNQTYRLQLTCSIHRCIVSV
jgi:hypothetical protein